MSKRLTKLPLSLATLVSAALLLGSCDGGPTNPEQELTPIHVTAFAVGTPVSTLVIEVTAADIEDQLVYNLEVVDGVASGEIRVPAGEARTFTVLAFDDQHNITHEGSVTTDVKPGQNQKLKVKLRGRSGKVPIEVTFGDYAVLVTPPVATIDATVATQLQLELVVLDPDGETIEDPLVQWATTHPTLATVSSSGLVTGLANGEVTIIATFEGVGGLSQVTLVGFGGGEEPPDGEVLGPVYPPDFPVADVVFTTNGANAGDAGGQDFYFTGFDISLVDGLAWGYDPSHPIVLSLDGTTDNTVAFSSGDSDLMAGVLVWTGSSPFTYWDDGTSGWVATTVPTRLTITVTDGLATAIELLDPTLMGLPGEIGGLAPITENYPDGGANSPFTAHLLAEAFFDGSWYPVLVLFDSYQNPVGHQAILDFWDGFYYVALP